MHYVWNKMPYRIPIPHFFNNVRKWKVKTKWSEGWATSVICHDSNHGAHRHTMRRAMRRIYCKGNRYAIDADISIFVAGRKLTVTGIRCLLQWFSCYLWIFTVAPPGLVSRRPPNDAPRESCRSGQRADGRTAATTIRPVNSTWPQRLLRSSR